MTLEEKMTYVNRVYGLACAKGLCKTRVEFARLLDINPTTLSGAMRTRPEYLTDKMIGRVKLFATSNNLEGELPEDNATSIPVIPVEAMAGTLKEFFQSVQEYDCERMISPIKGADYAIKVNGDSMSPEIPNGSHILLKRILEDQFVEWGKIFCLDTANGAVIKRVFPTDDPEVVECRSINPEYPSFKVNTKHINGWYRVLMVMSFK